MEKIEQKVIKKIKLNNGQLMPSIGMGTFGSDRVSAQKIADAVANGIELGYRLIDCASVYGNEKEIGNALKSVTVPRDELFITSKVWNDMHEKVAISCKQTLEDLQLEYLDMYLVHWPFPNFHPPKCDVDCRNENSKPFSVEEFMTTWKAMESLVDKGIVKGIGMSNMTIPKLEVVLPLCRIKPACIELELHPSFQQKELFKYCIDKNIQPIGYCPIGSPARPDRDKMEDDVVDTTLPSIVSIANKRGVHPAEICLKWSHRLGAIPIPFSTTEKNYYNNLKCTTELPLQDDEMAEIAIDDKNCRLVKGHVFLWKEAKDWNDLWDNNGTITK